MPITRTSYWWPVVWLVFYAGVLPYAVPACLDWLSRSSNWWLGCGILGLQTLTLGVALSLYQAGQALTRYFLSSKHTPPSSRF